MVKVISEYVYSRNSFNNGKSIFNDSFEDEIKTALKIAFDNKSNNKPNQKVVLSYEELNQNLVSENKHFGQSVAQKLKDICKSLNVGYNGIVSNQTKNREFVIDLAKLKDSTFNINKRKSN